MASSKLSKPPIATETHHFWIFLVHHHGTSSWYIIIHGSHGSWFPLVSMAFEKALALLLFQQVPRQALGGPIEPKDHWIAFEGHEHHRDAPIPAVKV